MPPAASRRVTWAKIFACAVVLCVWVGAYAAAWNHPDGSQWDLKSYYYAARVHENGSNPYDVHQLRAISGGRRTLPYYYPLPALSLLKPLGRLDYPDAHRVWLVLKALAMAALVVVWKRWFLPKTDWLWLLLVSLFGFGGATLWDIRAGNISVFEQLFLWTGFAFLLRSRVGAFVASVVLASTFKILPAAFLLLLLLPGLRTRSNLTKMVAGFVAVTLVVLLPFLGHADWFHSFVRGLRIAQPRLESNPTFFGILDELAVHHGVTALAGSLKYVLLAAYASALLLASRRLLRTVYGSKSIGFAVMVAAMLYALLIPRFIIYSYMIAFVPVLALLIPALARSKLAAYVALAAVCIGGVGVLPGGVGEFLDHAAPFLVLLGCWTLLIALEKTGGLRERAHHEADA
jgi:hypothetical protein